MHEISALDSPVVRQLKLASNEKLALLPVSPAERARVLGSKVDYFSASSLWIRPKETEGGLAPFAFNPIQMDYLAGLRLRHRLQPGVDIFRGIRDVILKPRQLGFTTFLAALFFCDGLFNPGRNCLVLTHLDKVSQEVLKIYRAFYEGLPLEMRKNVRLRRASSLHLELEFLDDNGKPDPVNRPPSSFIVHTAAGFDLRGITVHNLHCSEAAFYDNWLELVRGVIQAVPASGNILLESTANGFNHYKDLVDTALTGAGAYRLVFYPWFAHPEYARPLSADDRRVMEVSLDEEERKLLAAHPSLTLEALAWRRYKISEMGGSLDSFRQEYPSTVMDAFLSSGRPVFQLGVVASNFEKAKSVTPWQKRDEFTTIYFPPHPLGIYVGSADPAEGIDKGEGDAKAEIGGTDFSSFSIRDAATLRTMATIHGRLDPAEFARRIAALGEEYNSALLVVERNNHGHLVLYCLEQAMYPNLYRHLEYDSAGNSFLKLGFPMTVTTRPLVLDALKAVVDRDALPDPDPGFWREALTFIYGPTGKAEAMPLRHDDRVLDRALGIYTCTLGAKAWGGDGLLRGADDSNLPLGNKAVPASTAPAPGFALGLPPETVHREVVTAEENLAPAAHPALSMLADLRRSAADQDPYVPRCGNCRHKADRNGQLVCGLQGFLIQATDPSCSAWDMVDGGYNDEDPPRRVFLGG